MKKRIPFIILAVFVTLFIFSNSFETAEVSGQSSKKIVEAVAKAISTTLKKSPDTNLITYCVRKTAHIMEFALQGFCLSGCFAFARMNLLEGARITESRYIKSLICLSG